MNLQLWTLFLFATGTFGKCFLSDEYPECEWNGSAPFCRGAKDGNELFEKKGMKFIYGTSSWERLPFEISQSPCKHDFGHTCQRFFEKTLWCKPKH